ncbi:MAG: hypothetical protein ACFCBU_09035 [Cyanophyceae cyanobacterium]
MTEYFSHLTVSTIFEFVKIFLIALSPVISILSLLNAVKMWREGNRPLICALVEMDVEGNVGSMYSLNVVNRGNRPSKNLTLATRLTDKELLDLHGPEKYD